MNNEEKILQLLEQQGKTLERHSKLLEQQEKTLERHSELLEQQGKILAQHSELLEQQGKILAQHSEALEELREVVTKVAVTQEGLILPRLDLLAEGHTHLADTLAPVSRVEKLEEDVDLMKSTVRLLTHDVAELKKAQ